MDVKSSANMFNELADQYFRGRCTGGNSQRAYAIQPAKIDIFRFLDKPSRRARAFSNLNEPQRIRTVWGADNQNKIAPSRDCFHGGLPVGSRVANVFALGACNAWKASLQRGDDVGRVIDRQRCLRQECQVVGVGDLQGFGVVDGLDQSHGSGRNLSESPYDFGVTPVPHEDDMSSCLYLSLRLTMYFRNERAGRIKICEPAIFGVGWNRFGNTMRRKDDLGTGRNLIQFIDENGPFCLEAVDYKFVMYDFMADEDGRAMAFQRLFDNLDCTVYARAETARCG